MEVLELQNNTALKWPVREMLEVYIALFRVMLAEAEKALLATVHVYTPAAVTVRVCVYCAVVVLSNTVSVRSVTVIVESLFQVTVVAGPPVEIQVRMNLGLPPLRSEVGSQIDIVI